MSENKGIFNGAFSFGKRLVSSLISGGSQAQPVRSDASKDALPAKRTWPDLGLSLSSFLVKSEPIDHSDQLCATEAAPASRASPSEGAQDKVPEVYKGGSKADCQPTQPRTAPSTPPQPLMPNIDAVERQGTSGPAARWLLASLTMSKGEGQCTNQQGGGPTQTQMQLDATAATQHHADYTTQYNCVDAPLGQQLAQLEGLGLQASQVLHTFSPLTRLPYHAMLRCAWHDICALYYAVEFWDADVRPLCTRRCHATLRTPALPRTRQLGTLWPTSRSPPRQWCTLLPLLRASYPIPQACMACLHACARRQLCDCGYAGAIC